MRRRILTPISIQIICRTFLFLFPLFKFPFHFKPLFTLLAVELPVALVFQCIPAIMAFVVFVVHSFSSIIGYAFLHLLQCQSLCSLKKMISTLPLHLGHLSTIYSPSSFLSFIIPNFFHILTTSCADSQKSCGYALKLVRLHLGQVTA